MRKTFLLLFVLLIAATGLYAQSRLPGLEILYWDDGFEVQIFDENGNELYADYDVFWGDYLYEGWSIVTHNSTVELKLAPNGSIVKLAPDTSFSVSQFQTQDPGTTNVFALAAGKLKTVASRVSGNEKYQIDTPSAVCGVRGTNFIVNASQTSTKYILKEGKIWFGGKGADVFGDAVSDAVRELTPDGNNAGIFNGALGEFTTLQIPVEQIDSLFASQDFTFERAVENRVVQVTPPPTSADQEGQEGEAAVQTTEGQGGGFVSLLLEYLGAEIGTVTIGDVTYSKAIIQPQFDLGKFRTKLYLPIIYQSNLFDPQDWYHPQGNDEWSFGLEDIPRDANGDPIVFADDTAELMWRIGDFTEDLFLKIKYVEWGNRDIDPFYFKVGNLNNMSLGHGSIMWNFANDADFPAVRRVGINAGIPLGSLGIEGVVNDIANPEIMGGRLYLKLGGKNSPAAIGTTVAADTAPLRVDETDPGPLALLGVGADVEFKIIFGDSFYGILFGDAAGMVPYFRQDMGYGTGLYTKAMLTDNGVENYGLSSGIYGNLLGISYRVEYRDYNGTFKPAFFDMTYERNRYSIGSQYVTQLGETIDKKVQGFYGQAGGNLFNLVELEAGYMWPFADGQLIADDYIHGKVSADIPFPGGKSITGAVSYDRNGFVSDMRKVDAGDLAKFEWFTAKTVLKGEVVYPLAPIVDLAVVVGTTTSADPLDPTVLNVSPTFSIETRLRGE